MAESEAQSATQRGASFLKPSLSFESNVGQAEAPIEYLARGPGYRIFLSPTDATIILHRPHPQTSPASPTDPETRSPQSFDYATLKLQFIGPHALPTSPVGHQQLSGQSHYFLGNDPAGWHTNVPHYSQVVYEAIYPGIDLIYYGQGEKLEYDLVVAPGANPKHILLEIQGADNLTVLPEGSLQIGTPLGSLIHHQPIIYQEHEGRRHTIAGAYRLHSSTQVSFDIGAYDATRPLYIDPVLSYGSYIPSKGVNGLAIDLYNAIYITGAALPFYSADTNALDQPPPGYLDLFVSKFDSTGTQLIYSAYLGGAWDDQGRDLAVDDAGNVYVVGISSSLNFPLTNPLQFNSPIKPENSGFGNSGSYDVVIAKLNPQGNFLKYASYLGGCGEDGLFGNLAIDVGEDLEETREEDDPPLRTVYLAGSTNSPDFPLLDPFQPAYGRTLDTFVTKLRAEETSLETSETPILIYSTFLGGTNSDIAGDIRIDEEGQAYIVGTTFSPDFPTHNAFQDVIGNLPDDLDPQSTSDIFLTKFQPDGLGLVYSTYLGGYGNDEGHGLTLNRFGQVFLTGNTRSIDFPKTPELPPRRLPLDADVIVGHISALGTSLLNAVRIRGSADETGLAIALERGRRVWVTGRTASDDFPVTLGAPQRLLGKLITSDDPELSPEKQEVATVDAFVLNLTPRGQSLEFSTYLGGNGQDEGRAIAVRFLPIFSGPPDLTSTVVVGRTQSTNFPRTAAQHPLPSGGFLVNFLESDVPEDPEERFPCPPFCFPIPLPTPPFVTPSFPPVTADLTITMEDTPNPVVIGRPLEYTITVTNHGPNVASNVIVTDVLPPWFQLTGFSPTPDLCRRDFNNQAVVCFLGSLTPDAQVTFTISGLPLAASIRVDGEEEEEIFKMPNRASVFSHLPDPDYTNNSTAVFTKSIDPNAQTLNNPLADLSIMKNDVFLRFDFETGEVEIVTPEDPDPITHATVGRPYFYEITVTNAEEVAITVVETDDAGNPILDENNNPIRTVQVVPTNAATDIILTDLLPPNLTAGFWSIDPPQGFCQSIPDFRCFLGHLDPGATVFVTIWVMPSTPEDIVNGVLVTTSTTEPPGRTRNTDIEETAIQIPQAIEAADLRVTFSDEEELVLTEEDERDENEDPPDPVDPDQHTGRGEVTWKFEVLNSGPDKAVNVLATSRLRVMEIIGLAPTTITHLDSIPPSPLDLRIRGIRHFQPLKGERLTADNFQTKCPNGEDEEGEPCEIDGTFECTDCEVDSPLCVLCQGDDCLDIAHAFRTEEELSPEGEPTGHLLVTWVPVEPEHIIPETILSELEDFDDQEQYPDHQEEIILSCNIGTLQSEEKFLLDFSVDLTQGIHNSQAQATSLTFDPDPSSNKSAAVTTVAVPAGHPTRGGVGGDEGLGNQCFIATAAYGSPLAREVVLLRHFRDQYLLPSTAGQLLVRAYYFSSPPLAAFIGQHPQLKAVIRMALWPVVWWAHLTLNSPSLGLALLLGGFLLACSLLYWAIRARPHSKFVTRMCKALSYKKESISL